MVDDGDRDEPGLVGLLEGATAGIDPVVDPVAIRGRVDRRRRRRVGVVAAAVGLLLLVPIALQLGDDRPRVLLEAPPSVEASPADAPPVQVPPPVVGEVLEVEVDFELTGPLAEELELTGLVEGPEERTRVGFPVMAWLSAGIRAVGPEAARLPPVAEEAAGLGVGGWVAETGGLRVTVSPPSRPVAVVAGGPPGAVGERVAADVVPVWLPRSLSVSIESTDLRQDASPRTVRVPIGASTLVVGVTFTPVPAGPPAPPDPVADAVGQVLQVPALGEAAQVVMPDGVPVWIAHTARSGVTVVDGRTPFRISGISQLTRWCASAQGWYEAFGGSRFLPDGTPAFGPAPRGLVTYQTEPAGEGAVRITGSRQGAGYQPPDVWPPAIDTFGNPINQPQFDGPNCNEGDVGTSVDIPGLAQATVGDLAEGVVLDGVRQVQGRLRLDEAGRGVLCQQGGTGATCAGLTVPVDLSAHVTPRPEDAVPFDAVAYDITVAVVLQDGVIVEAWASGFVDGIYDPPFTTATRTITRVTEVRTGALAERDCAGQPSGCAAVLQLERLLLVGPDGPIPGQRTADGLADALPGDALPDDWVVLTESVDGLSSGTNLSLARGTRLADGGSISDIPVGDLVLVTYDGAADLAVVRIEE